ncbi:MAG: hypothetical protein CMH64_00325 [Nanoarchaeota archaeon]|nr:hypothetical protein [Nanoarchaeota archaeon]|tara:strand:- start:1357 stop:2340 length:984 start_codon:yes stop_codon:yes gene_type:complete
MSRISKYKLKKLIKNISLLVVVVIIFLSLGELIARFANVEKSEYDVFFMEGNSNLSNQLIPNAEGYFKDHYTKINKDGFRDNKDYSVKKPRDVLRIISLGASFTFGEGVDLEDTYSKQLEVSLNNYCEDKIEVLNMGVSGYNMVYELETLKEKGLKYGPDLIMVNLFSRPNVQYRYFPLKDSLKRHSYLFAYLRKKYQIVNLKYLTAKSEQVEGGEIFVNTIGREQNEKTLQEFIDIGKGKDVSILFLYFPILEDEEDFVDPDVEFYKNMLEYLESVNEDNLDLTDAFVGKNFEDLWVSKNNHHPNRKGHEIAAEELHNHIVKKIEC